METVLIVDDHAAFRTQARRMLEAAGHVVVAEAGSGADALAAWVRLRPSLVLLDVQLPDANGFEIAAMMDGAVVVMISSYDEGTFHSRLAVSPARGFIPKDRLSARAIARVLAS